MSKKKKIKEKIWDLTQKTPLNQRVKEQDGGLKYRVREGRSYRPNPLAAPGSLFGSLKKCKFSSKILIFFSDTNKPYLTMRSLSVRLDAGSLIFGLSARPVTVIVSVTSEELHQVVSYKLTDRCCDCALLNIRYNKS